MILAFFQSPAMLGLLVAPALVAAMIVGALRWRKRALARLSSRENTELARARLVREVASVVAVVLLVLALARPAWRPRTEPVASDSRDVVFVLDVSRSMLARDRQPDRLESARIAIRDLVEHLRAGDRVGLVVFSGSSLIVCPLTNDVAFFYKALSEATPSSVAFGGTRIGDALRKTADKLLADSGRRGFQDVILLTDGEDQDSEIAAAIEDINQREAALLVIGLGSDAEGARIPEGDGFALYRGREVWTRQDSVMLEEVSRLAKAGLYLNAGTRAIDLPNVYLGFTQHSASTRSALQATNRLAEEFPWFLGAAFTTLLVPGAWRPRWRRRAGVAAAIAVGGQLAAATPPTDGQKADAGFAEAAARYVAAARASPDPRVQAMNLYNAGTSWLQAAAEINQFAAAAADSPEAALPRATALIAAAEDDEGDEAGPDASAMLEQSIQLYESALRLQPEFSTAARNLEIARARWLKQHEEEEKRQQEQTGEPDPSNAMSDTDADASDMNDTDDTDDADADAADSSAGENASQPSDTTLADLLNRNLPPPSVSPQDIIRHELENSQLREAPVPPKKKAVEKNW